MRNTKNDSIVLVRLPKEIKEIFQEQCREESIDMSVKIRHIIISEIKKNRK